MRKAEISDFTSVFVNTYRELGSHQPATPVAAREATV